MKKFLTGFLVLSFGLSVFSQESAKRYTVDLKGGFTIPFHYNKGILLGADLSQFYGTKMLTVGYSYMEEFTIWTSADYAHQQIEFLYGKQLNIKIVAFQVQAGAGPVWGKRRVDNELENYFTGGIFLKAGYRFIPLKFAGMAADVELNLNPKNPVFLFTFGITVGRLHSY